MKLDLNYVFQNLAASVKIILGNAQGLSEIDQSSSGFWRSFIVLLLALPFTLSAKYSEYNSVESSANNEHMTILFSWPVTQEIASILAYFLSLGTFFAMTKSTGLVARFPLSIITLNWGGLALTIISFPIVLLTIWMAKTNPFLPFVSIFLIFVFAVATFNILRLTLEIPSRPAILYVFVLSVIEILAYFLLLILTLN